MSATTAGGNSRALSSGNGGSWLKKAFTARFLRSSVSHPQVPPSPNHTSSRFSRSTHGVDRENHQPQDEPPAGVAFTVGGVSHSEREGGDRHDDERVPVGGSVVSTSGEGVDGRREVSLVRGEGDSARSHRSKLVRRGSGMTNMSAGTALRGIPAEAG